MKKKKVLIVSLSVFVVIAVAVGLLYWRFFLSMSFLPEGELIESKTCEECGITINAYLVNSGATVDYCIRCEKVTPEGKSKNIYWGYREYDASLKWIDCKTISINGRSLNVDKDKYDFRRDDGTAFTAMPGTQVTTDPLEAEYAERQAYIAECQEKLTTALNEKPELFENAVVSFKSVAEGREKGIRLAFKNGNITGAGISPEEEKALKEVCSLMSDITGCEISIDNTRSYGENVIHFSSLKNFDEDYYEFGLNYSENKYESDWKAAKDNWYVFEYVMPR